MTTDVNEKLLSFEISDRAGSVSAILLRPANAQWLYVLGHGAGAGMRHPFLETMARALFERDVATFRYQFPYMEAGRRAPNARPILVETVRAAVETAQRAAPDLRVVAGGKSMGGRMTSLAAAEATLPDVEGLVFLGFPLHAAGKPSADRGAHLDKVGLPMLFIQGTRDRLADVELLQSCIDRVEPKPQLSLVATGDHSFKVLKSAGQSYNEVLTGIADTIAAWLL
jgi:hypothetical protein